MKHKKRPRVDFELANHFESEYVKILEQELGQDKVSVLRLIELLADHEFDVHLAILVLRERVLEFISKAA